MEEVTESSQTLKKTEHVEAQDFPEAIEEMRYAAARCERLLQKRPRGQDVYNQRRRGLAEGVLARC